MTTPRRGKGPGRFPTLLRPGVLIIVAAVVFVVVDLAFAGHRVWWLFAVALVTLLVLYNAPRRRHRPSGLAVRVALAPSPPGQSLAASEQGLMVSVENHEPRVLVVARLVLFAPGGQLLTTLPRDLQLPQPLPPDGDLHLTFGLAEIAGQLRALGCSGQVRVRWYVEVTGGKSYPSQPFVVEVEATSRQSNGLAAAVAHD